jgi:hypothetical protein
VMNNRRVLRQHCEKQMRNARAPLSISTSYAAARICLVENTDIFFRAPRHPQESTMAAQYGFKLPPGNLAFSRHRYDLIIQSCEARPPWHDDKNPLHRQPACGNGLVSLSQQIVA